MAKEKTPRRQGWSDEQEGRMRSAESDYQDAERLVRQISAERLAELKSGPRVAAKVVTEDPTLIPADREELVRWLGKRQVRPPRRRWLPRRPRRLSVRPAILAVAVVGAAIPIAMGWWNTPLGLVTFARESTVHWSADGRYVGMQGVPPGTQYDVMSVDEETQTVKIRGWTPHAGYSRAEVPFDLLKR